MSENTEWKWWQERAVRHRASNRGFQIIQVGGREGRRRAAAGIGPCMLVDHERVHLFAATFAEIRDYLADKPEVVTPLHDNQQKKLRALRRQQQPIGIFDEWDESDNYH